MHVKAVDGRSPCMTSMTAAVSVASAVLQWTRSFMANPDQCGRHVTTHHRATSPAIRSRCQSKASARRGRSLPDARRPSADGRQFAELVCIQDRAQVQHLSNLWSNSMRRTALLAPRFSPPRSHRRPRRSTRACSATPTSRRRRSSSSMPGTCGWSRRPAAPRLGSARPRARNPSPASPPDGASIAYTANYDGNQDIYVVPTAGGPATRITHHPGRTDSSTGFRTAVRCSSPRR